MTSIRPEVLPAAGEAGALTVTERRNMERTNAMEADVRIQHAPLQLALLEMLDTRHQDGRYGQRSR
jgi:hypothetical protein